MVYSIAVIDQYLYHAQVIFGLEIEAHSNEFPLLVGCSLRSSQGCVVDLPARWLLSPGQALWDVKGTDEFKIGSDVFSEWSGQIKFALWRDDTFNQRLADSGWLAWHAPYMIGASTAGLDIQDQRIKDNYGDRLHVWKKM